MNSDEHFHPSDSAKDGERLVHSRSSDRGASQQLCNDDVKGTRAADNHDAVMEDLVDRMLKLTVDVEQLIQMRNSPRGTAHHSKDVTSKHKSWHDHESRERQHRHSSDERQSRPGDDDPNDDDMRELGAQFMDFIKLRTSPKSTSPRDKHNKDEYHSRRPHHDSDDDDRGKSSLHKRHESIESGSTTPTSQLGRPGQGGTSQDSADWRSCTTALGDARRHL